MQRRSVERQTASLVKMTKAILFDLGNVIVGLDYGRYYAELSGLRNQLGEDITNELNSTDLLHRFERGEISSQDFFRGMRSVLSLRCSYSEFCRAFCSLFLPVPLISEKLLSGLSSRYRLILVSNTNPIHFCMVRENYPILRFFHDFVLSFEVRSMKPSMEIYHAALTRAGCSPQECFFVDDKEENVNAALKQGIDAVQFNSPQQLEKDLRTRRIHLRKP